MIWMQERGAGACFGIDHGTEESGFMSRCAREGIIFDVPAG
jgi:hypothetical protein